MEYLTGARDLAAIAKAKQLLDAAGYRDGSPITHAGKLRGNLLLVHGTGDDNCHYQNCEVLVNELVRLHKPFMQVAYPNRSHSIDEGQNTKRHLYATLRDYLREHLGEAAKMIDMITDQSPQGLEVRLSSSGDC